MTSPPGYDSFVALSGIAKRTLLEPIFTAPLLAYSLQLLPQIPNHLLPDIFHRISPYVDRSRATNILAVLFGLGVLRKTSNFLTDRTANNWTSDTYDWTKEIVVITGGSSGLGEQVVKQLLQKGIKVVVIDINEPKYELPSPSKFFKCDLSSPTQIASTCASIRTTLGHPTVLLNNAGIASGKLLLDTPPNEYNTMFQINTISHFLLTREFLPEMIKNNHGHILTTASMASFMTVAWNVSYSQVKASALAFHEGLTQELRHVYMNPAFAVGEKTSEIASSLPSKRNGKPPKCKIRTTIFHPTWIDTPLIAHMTKLDGWKEPTLKTSDVAGKIVEVILSGRSGGQVCLPEGYAGARLIKGLPGWMQEGIRDMGAKVGSDLLVEGGFEVPSKKYDFKEMGDKE